MRKKILNSRSVNHTRRQFKIKLEEFKNHLSSLGSDINNWPSHIRDDALRTIEASSEARALLEEEGKFEEILNLRTLEEPSPELGSNIISQADPRDSETVNTSFYEYLSGFFSFLKFQKPQKKMAAPTPTTAGPTAHIGTY